MTSTTRQRSVLATIVLAIVLAGAVLCAPVATAQEVPDPTNETTEADDDSTRVVEQLGDLVVHSYDYDSDSETMTIDATWNGETPTTATFTEMVELDDAGATEITFKNVRLLPDSRTEIEVGASPRSGGSAAVMVTTQQSIENNSAVVLQAGDGGGSDPVPFNATVALIGLAAAGGGFGTFWLTRRRYIEEEDAWSDRIA